MAPMVDGGETTGGLEAEPGGAPVFTAVFSGPTSGPAVESRAKHYVAFLKRETTVW